SAGPNTATVIGTETDQFAPSTQRTPIEVRPQSRAPGARNGSIRRQASSRRLGLSWPKRSSTRYSGPNWVRTNSSISASAPWAPFGAVGWPGEALAHESAANPSRAAASERANGRGLQARGARDAGLMRSEEHTSE